MNISLSSILRSGDPPKNSSATCGRTYSLEVSYYRQPSGQVELYSLSPTCPLIGRTSKIRAHRCRSDVCCGQSSTSASARRCRVWSVLPLFVATYTVLPLGCRILCHMQKDATPTQLHCPCNTRFRIDDSSNGGVKMELITTAITAFALAGLAVGYFIVFAQSKKGGSGYFIVACCCVILSATYAWKAYAAVAHSQQQVQAVDR